ncbi:hypothetical protein HETIRDRAFT_320411 [Heterobasidion irregulare TC 32-1]|uniref:Uncharacterized protein n=1 Tax=Heterobasidion irregulare (strain TC 32-1) TaxID=747525 RepID=W4K4I9_HETIT|nr:uncharacterized protein HETIRDRAFT_320411 [Heterobasidion irregulare TC 32-1]ETW80748.1 hypothetical protein HETIRDRAFT_320411 [Heterobasidion irregulare TC 32-1]
MLMSRQTAFLWRASYANASNDVPTCPEDMSGPAWASLLFGGAICQYCGARPIMKVIFVLRRRVCNSCMKTHLDTPEKYIAEMKSKAPFICEFTDSLPYTDYVLNSHGKMLLGEYWWDEDVRALIGELSAIYRRISAKPLYEQKEIMQELRATKETAFQARMNHATICSEWVQRVELERINELNELRSKRIAE